MKRFKFRLEAVETIRKRREEDALLELSRAKSELQSILDRKAALESDLSDALSRRESLGITPVGADAFAMEEAFISGLKRRIRQAEQHAQRAARFVERATRIFLHARRDLHVIETLREREQEEFRREQGRMEMKEADELSSLRAARERIQA